MKGGIVEKVRKLIKARRIRRRYRRSRFQQDVCINCSRSLVDLTDCLTD